MIIAKLTKDEMALLNRDRYAHPDPVVQRRLNALYFKGLGYSHHEICQLAGVSSTTLSTLLKLYQEGGIEAVTNVAYHSPTSQLDYHASTIEDYFRKNPPHTVKEACLCIEKRTGVKRKETQVRKFLHRMGMKPRKTGSIPKKIDPEKQEEFKKKDWSHA